MVKKTFEFRHRRLTRFPDRLRRYAITDCAIRNIRIHKAERPDNGILPDRHPRHHDAVRALHNPHPVIARRVCAAAISLIMVTYEIASSAATSSQRQKRMFCKGLAVAAHPATPLQK